jgi:hypothetical protein
VPGAVGGVGWGRRRGLWAARAVVVRLCTGWWRRHRGGGGWAFSLRREGGGLGGGLGSLEAGGFIAYRARSGLDLGQAGPDLPEVAH